MRSQVVSKPWFMFHGMRKQQEDPSIDIPQDSCDSRSATYHSRLLCDAAHNSVEISPSSHPYSIGLIVASKGHLSLAKVSQSDFLGFRG